MTIQPLHATHSRITVQTVINCYRHTSFIKKASDSVEEQGIQELSLSEPGPRQTNDPYSGDINLLDGVMLEVFSRYVNTDNDLLMSADATDAHTAASEGKWLSGLQMILQT